MPQRRVISGALVLASFILTQIASADWQVASLDRESSAVAGVQHRHFVLQNSAESATIDLAFFRTNSATLRVIDNPGGSENLCDVMRRENFIAGVNGGYFDTQFRPIGLRVIDGTTRSPLIRARLLTGVLCASSRGIEIVRRGEFSQKKKCMSAVGCGPFLIDGGMAVHGLDRSRRARRTFIATARGGEAALGISSSLSLAELAGALAALPDFKIWRALNLDGGSSSAFWFRKKDGGAFSISEEKSVRDFVGIIAK
jgi:phosphodiester glycosidase